LADVELRRHAERGGQIPEGCAVNADGRPTTDVREALQGTLLALGGFHGANLALVVEVLAGGLAGGRWSLDAPAFDRGGLSPGAGLLVAAFDLRTMAPHLPGRLAFHLRRLSALGIHVPGTRRRQANATEIDGALATQIGGLVERNRLAS
jgi:(2R)-3-sulfolactate dehydrogenase (NADP+)